MLSLYLLFPHDETEEITAAPSDLIIAESPQPNETPPLNDETKPVEETQSEKILIEIKGQVEKPGVFELPAESRLHNAVDLAGGFLPEADALSLNLAMKLSDEMSIYVPKIGEAATALPPTVASPSTAASSVAEGGGPVNINTADETSLMTLPGIGPSKAAAIIAYRDENGPFSTIDNLKDVSGIGDKTFEKLQDTISVN